MDLRAMAMKGLTAFPEAPQFLESHHQIITIISRTLVVGSYPSTDKQSVYSKPSTDWANFGMV